MFFFKIYFKRNILKKIFKYIYFFIKKWNYLLLKSWLFLIKFIGLVQLYIKNNFIQNPFLQI